MEHPFHYLTDIVSMVVGIELYLKTKTRDDVPEHARIFIIIGALFGALFGSRLIAALEDPYQFIHATSLIYYYGNKTIIGGSAGGILGVEVAKRILNIKSWTGDRALVPLAVAIIIGRIGCFVTGVSDGTVGSPCNYFWCLEQGDGMLRHPNSLYEIIFILLFLFFYALCNRLEKRTYIAGTAFRVFIVLYFTLRFFIEFLKDTHPIIFEINSIQIVCVIFALWYVRDIFHVFTARQKKQILLDSRE